MTKVSDLAQRLRYLDTIEPNAILLEAADALAAESRLAAAEEENNVRAEERVRMVEAQNALAERFAAAERVVEAARPAGQHLTPEHGLALWNALAAYDAADLNKAKQKGE